MRRGWEQGLGGSAGLGTAWATPVGVAQGEVGDVHQKSAQMHVEYSTLQESKGVLTGLQEIELVGLGDGWGTVVLFEGDVVLGKFARMGVEWDVAVGA